MVRCHSLDTRFAGAGDWGLGIRNLEKSPILLQRVSANDTSYVITRQAGSSEGLQPSELLIVRANDASKAGIISADNKMLGRRPNE